MATTDTTPFSCPFCWGPTTESTLSRPQENGLRGKFSYYRVCHGCSISFRVSKAEVAFLSILRKVGLDDAFMRTLGQRQRNSMLYLRRNHSSIPEVEVNFQPAYLRKIEFPNEASLQPRSLEQSNITPTIVAQRHPPFLLEINSDKLGFKFHVSIEDRQLWSDIANSLIAATKSIGSSLSKLAKLTAPPERKSISDQDIYPPI